MVKLIWYNKRLIGIRHLVRNNLDVITSDNEAISNFLLTRIMFNS
jgi:hypothetical protein